RTCAAAVPRDIDREFGDAVVTRATAVEGCRGERHNLSPLFDNDDRTPAVKPSLDLLRASWLSLESADAIGHALIVDCRNGFSVRRRRCPGRKPVRHHARSYQPRER